MNDKIDQLEYTVMELGTEIFRLKTQISEMTNVQESMSKTLTTLKDILDEKGVICEEDFDAASPYADQSSLEDSEQIDLSNITGSNKNDFH